MIHPLAAFHAARDLVAGLLISIGSFVGAGQWEDEEGDDA